MEEDKVKQGQSRRDFLKTSAYAAYATPVIVSMLVQKANAAKSWNSGWGKLTDTGKAPHNAPLGPDPGRGTNNPPPTFVK
jgi:hypothetical protein